MDGAEIGNASIAAETAWTSEGTATCQALAAREKFGR
jgi:hypothetical protein